MKKFGTPNGAGPGNENENVGFPADGTPPEPRNPEEDLLFDLALFFPEDGAPPVDFFFLFGFFFFLAGFLALGLCAEGFCFFPEPEGVGGPEDPVLVPVEVVVVVGTETEPDPVDPVVPVDPVPVEPEPGAPDEHDSVTPITGSFTGSEIEDNGVPAGTFTVKESLPPPTTVTVITHESAWATGIAAIAETARTDPPVASATTSFRLLNTLAYLLPAGSSRTCRDGRGSGRTLLIGFKLCNAEPFMVGVCLSRRKTTSRVSTDSPTGLASADRRRHCSPVWRGSGSSRVCWDLI